MFLSSKGMSDGQLCGKEISVLLHGVKLSLALLLCLIFDIPPLCVVMAKLKEGCDVLKKKL